MLLENKVQSQNRHHGQQEYGKCIIQISRILPKEVILCDRQIFHRIVLQEHNGYLKIIPYNDYIIVLIICI